MKRPSVFLWFALSCCIAYAQPVESLSFEVASIKPAPPLAPKALARVGCLGGPGPNSRNPGRLTCENVTVGLLVSLAWNLKRYQIDEPQWVPPRGISTTSLVLQGDRFGVVAKIPERTTLDQFRQMLQNLLKERFKLALHFEKKEVPGYELLVAKGGLKMKEAAPPQEKREEVARPASASSPPQGPTKGKDGYPVLNAGLAVMGNRARWVAFNISMEQIANTLVGQLNRPVVDATGLKAKYDVNLYWATEQMMRASAAAGPDGSLPSGAELDVGPTLLSAIQGQLGLKLQPKKVSAEVVVIDHVEKVPTEN